MRKIFDVRCTKCDNVDEVFGYMDQTYPCSVCGSDAERLITPVSFHLDGASGHFPTASDKWVADHKRRAKKPRDN